MKRLVLLVVALSCAPAGRACALLPPFPPDDSIRAWAQERVDGRYARGIVVGLLDRGTRRFIGVGTANDSLPGAPNAHTVFEIGSMTKVFTATLLADMVTRGEVALDDSVTRYLPDSVRIAAKDGKPITLASLATHTAGLPRLPANFTPRDAANPYADYSVEQLYAFLRGFTPRTAPGARWDYSNLGAGLLGHALTRRAGRDFETLMRERILDPLGMHETAITLPAAWRPRLATPHDEGGDATSWWDLPTLAGAGALRSTADDMLTFLAAQLPRAGGKLGAAIGLTQQSRAFTGRDSVDIGLGWLIRHLPGGDMYMHDGGTGGFRSFMAFDPGSGRAVVVLANQSADVNDLGAHCIDSGLPLHHLAPRVVRTVVMLPPATLDRFVGEYAVVPTFVLTLTRDGSQLYAQATNQPKFPIYASSDSTFFYKVVDAQLSFERDGDGRIVALTLHQNGQNIPATKRK